MNLRIVILLNALAILCLPRIPAAETGDFDGDGRLSIRDVLHAREGLPEAPGSRDGLDAHPCHGAAQNWSGEYERAIVYLEGLRRSVPAPLPHWFPIWDAGDRPQAPLPGDDRVIVTVETVEAPGGTDDRVRIALTLSALAPVRAFTLILEADGDLLRVPIFKNGDYAFRHSRWYRIEGDALFGHVTGNVVVDVHPAAYLITGGKIVVMNFRGTLDYGPIGPEDFPIEMELRLARGTRAGSYPLRLLPSSEVLLEDGSLVAPMSAGPGRIILERDVEAGWDEGVPPLDLDAASRLVRGKVEFRLADALGGPPEAGQPVAEGIPGDIVSVRLQMRTETPLNRISARLSWPAGRLGCSAETRTLFPNPEEGGIYEAIRSGLPHLCPGNVIGLDGRFEVDFSTAGGTLSGYPTTLFKDRALEYFKPLGEWIDLVDLHLSIPADAVGGTDVPLVFRERDDRQPDRNSLLSFSPYGVLYPCDTTSVDDDRPPNWTYEVSYASSFVRVLGEPGPPPDPVDAGVRFAIGSASGRPGELLEVPIFAAAARPLNVLRLVLAADPALALESLDLEILSLLTGEYVRRDLVPGSSIVFEECNDPSLPPEERECAGGVPFWSLWRATEPGFFFLDLIGLRADYPGPELKEIARLRLRIREDARAAEVVIRAAAITWRPGQFDVEASSGGFLFPETEVFAPANAVSGGAITILGRGFRRGEVNRDGKVDLSDAVATLGYLFQGTFEPGCLDAADADDSGKVELTDAIFLLSALFLGGRAIPAPHPGCGSDVTGDELGCEEACR